MPDIPRFGFQDASVEHVWRLSAYAVIADDSGSIAVVRTPRGVFLPGGGQRDGESPEAAVVREIGEECGFLAEIVDRIGIAEEVVRSAPSRDPLGKLCTFFRCRIVGRAAAVEPDHETAWISTDAAARELLYGSQRWAVARIGE